MSFPPPRHAFSASVCVTCASRYVEMLTYRRDKKKKAEEGHIGRGRKGNGRQKMRSHIVSRERCWQVRPREGRQEGGQGIWDRNTASSLPSVAPPHHRHTPLSQATSPGPMSVPCLGSHHTPTAMKSSSPGHRRWHSWHARGHKGNKCQRGRGWATRYGMPIVGWNEGHHGYASRMSPPPFTPVRGGEMGNGR